MPKISLFLSLFLSLTSLSVDAATLTEAYQAALRKNEVVGLQTAQVQPRLEDATQRALFPEKQTSVALTGSPMAIAVIGGVFVSTFLTLFVVPCVYSLFGKFDRREKEIRAAAAKGVRA